MTVCQNPFAHALLKFGLPGNFPGIFRKSSGNTVFFAVALLGHLLARWRGIFFPAPAHVRKPPLARHRRNRNSQQKRPRARIIPGVVTQPGQASPHCCIFSRCRAIAAAIASGSWPPLAFRFAKKATLISWR